LDNLSKEERHIYLRFLYSALNILAFDDRDRLLHRIENLLTEETKNNIWDTEHVSIVNVFDTLTRDKNRLPARIELADKSSLSQKSIEKHIAEYFQSYHYKQRQQEFMLMRERLLSHCYKFAINGDMKAARLFFEATSDKRPETSIKNQQNNFVQINNLTITEEQINKLP
jgi:L-arabinose isomerase